MNRIIEGGHIILPQGVTQWTARGWEITQQIAQPGDRTIQLIDDLHGAVAINELEKNLPTLDCQINADIVVRESALQREAAQALDSMEQAGHITTNRSGKYFHGIRVMNTNSMPFVVLLDAGFTLLKHRLGYDHAVNVLPHFYEREQCNLLRIVEVLLPEFTLEVVLFNLEGNYWALPI